MNELALIQLFEKHSNPKRALSMEAYMRNQFSYFGIDSTLRKSLLKEWNKENPLNDSEAYLQSIISLFKYPKRECAYSAIELLTPWIKKFGKPEHFPLLTQFLLYQSWWDTVDNIAPNLMGELLKKYPQLIPQMVDEYNSSGNFWLQRTTLLFQLKYQKAVNREVLFSQCLFYADSQEFFLKKAIGWALRQYAKFEPELVYSFVDAHNFSNLSRREANKHRK